MIAYDALIEEILSQGTVLSLGTVDSAGVWVADVNYVHRDFFLYFASHPLCRHSRALEHNDRAAGTITLHTNLGEEEKGLQMSGLARRVYTSCEDIFSLYKHKRRKTENFTLPSEYVWYVFQPEKIDLIYEAVLGKQKKRFDVIGTSLLVRNNFHCD